MVLLCACLVVVRRLSILGSQGGGTFVFGAGFVMYPVVGGAVGSRSLVGGGSVMGPWWGGFVFHILVALWHLGAHCAGR